MSQSTTHRWRFVAGFAIEQHDWGEERAVFHTGTGQTHVLNAIAGAVLDCLALDEVAQGALEDRVAERLDYQVDAAFSDYLKRAVADLHAQDLIEAVSDP